MENVPYSERPTVLDLFSLSKRFLTGDMIAIFKYLTKKKIPSTKGLFILAEKEPRAESWSQNKPH